MGEIIKLDVKNYNKCNNIWDMKKKPELRDKFYNELISGNRITFVYEMEDCYMGEVSLVFDMNDSDYTIDNKRIYLSRFLVKKEMRNKGIGYIEMSVGVDLDNYIALMIYHKYGFDKIIKVDEDEAGKYLKLLKKL